MIICAGFFSFFNPIPMLVLAGWPGPESRADYRITAGLNPESALLSCTCEISFVPAFPADTLWLHLYPNAYRDPSTGFGGDQATLGDFGFASAEDDEYGWIELSEWTLGGDSVEILVDETLGFIPLRQTVLPGDTIKLAGAFSVKVPLIWSRMGHDGDHYEMSQWYPKMCVLDDDGWHLGEYRSEGEFFSDYGIYDVTLTLPDSFVTAATGGVDSIWFDHDSLIRSERWSAEDVHDFAWAADPAFVLLEHNFIPPRELSENAVRVHVAVQECDSEDWAEVGEWADSTLLYCSEWYGEYPYGELWIVQSAFYGGMEYPQLVMIGSFDPPFYRYFEMVVMHEIGHQWFYGMLGNDEVDEAWLDEGINSFNEIRYFERKYGLHGNITSLPAWIADPSDADGTSASYAGMVASGEEVPVLSTSTDAAGGRYDYGALYYSKPALFVRMLQNQIGGEDFDRIMQEYYRRFRYHHPGTDDFQSIVEEFTGRSWQAEFDTWLRSTESADVRVDAIAWSGDTTIVTVSGDIPLAVDLDLGVFRRGESFLARASIVPGTSTLVRVPGRWCRAEIDPETRYLDSRPWNNSLPAAGSIRPLLYPYDQPSRFNTWVFPVPGWADGIWEFGLFGMMHAASSWSGGPFELSGVWRQPLSDERPGMAAMKLEAVVDRSRTGRSSLSFDTWMGYGMGSISLEAAREFHGTFPSDPVLTIGAGAGLEGVSDNSIVGEDEYSVGYGSVFSLEASSWSRGMSGSRWASTEVQASPDWAGKKWIRAGIEASMSLDRMPGEPGTRLFAGRAWGGAPLQHEFRPGGGLRSGGVLGWLMPPAGMISPIGNYFVESGPALPGYGDSPVHGLIGLALGETISIPGSPVMVFADAGWIEDSMKDLTMENLLANAGISLNGGFLQAWFPVWVSDPPPGEDNWELRWRFAFNLWGLPMQLF